MMRLLSFLIATFVLILTSEMAFAQVAPPPGQPEPRSPLISTQELVRRAQALAKTLPRVIEIGPEGPLDDAFKDFDLPFPLANWFCTSDISARECRKNMDQARAPLPIQFVYRRGAAGPADITLRLRTKDVRLRPETITQVPLRDLSAAAISDRVNILIVRSDRQDPVGGLALTFAQEPALARPRIEDVTTPTVRHQIVVRLDRTGVASAPFLNPRWPPYLGPAGRGEDPSPWQDAALLVFSNQAGAEQFLVSFAGISDKNRWAFMAAGLELTDCHEGKCKATIIVPPGSKGEKKIPVRLLRDAYVKDGAAKVTGFSVSLFHDETQLANAHGYFSLVPFSRLIEDEGGTKWSAAVSADFGWTPDLSDLQATPDDDPIISAGTRRGAADDVKFDGSARIALEQSLGAAANGVFELRVKNGALGTDAKVTPTQYRLNIFGVRGARFSGGLFKVAEPSEAIALSEAGENIGVHYSFLDVNHLIRKYVPRLRKDALDFKDAQADRNHSATLLQLRGVPGLTWSRAQVDIYGLYGRKHATRCVELQNGRCPEQADASADFIDSDEKPLVFRMNQSYWTWGTEVGVIIHEGLTGTAALYRSRLSNKGRPVGATALLTDAGDGVAGLGTVVWTSYGKNERANEETHLLDAKPARFTLRGQLGAGSADDPATADHNEAYVGETAAFAPDELFLSVLAPAIRTSSGPLGSGLANKMYGGLLFSTPRWSPLSGFAHLMRVPSTDVDAVSTTLKPHEYWLRSATADAAKHLGTEVDAEFSIDAPAGVSYSVVLGSFWPGAAIAGGSTPVIHGTQWTATMHLTVKM